MHTCIRNAIHIGRDEQGLHEGIAANQVRCAEREKSQVINNLDLKTPFSTELLKIPRIAARWLPWGQWTRPGPDQGRPMTCLVQVTRQRFDLKLAPQSRRQMQHHSRVVGMPSSLDQPPDKRRWRSNQPSSPMSTLRGPTSTTRRQWWLPAQVERLRIGATVAAEITTSIVDRGVGFIVACRGVGATQRTGGDAERLHCGTTSAIGHFHGVLPRGNAFEILTALARYAWANPLIGVRRCAAGNREVNAPLSIEGTLRHNGRNHNGVRLTNSPRQTPHSRFRLAQKTHTTRTKSRQTRCLNQN